MNADSIETNSNRIAVALNMRRRTSPVPTWLRRSITQIMQESAKESASDWKIQTGKLYGRIDMREKRDFWFCMALVENLSYLPQKPELVEEVGRRALFCYYECTKRKQHSFLSQLRKSLRESQRSSFLSERQIACLLLEGEQVMQEELGSLIDSDTPGDLRMAIARRVVRLGQKEFFGDVISYFLDLCRLSDRREIEPAEYHEAERLIGEMREHYFADWLPLAYKSYSENFNEGSIKGRMLNVLAHSGDPLVEHLLELHHECSHGARRPIWRLLHQMVCNGSSLAYRALSELVLHAMPQEQKPLCEEIRQAISDYITKTLADRISVEILEMTKTLRDKLSDKSHQTLRDLGVELQKLLDWDVRHLHEMMEHLLQDTATPEEKNRLCRGGHITLNALIDVVSDPMRSLEQRLTATWFMLQVPACGSHPNLGYSLWTRFVEEHDANLRVALLAALAKSRWKATSKDRRIFEEIYRQSEPRLKVEINRHWNAIFPGSQPAENIPPCSNNLPESSI